MSKPLLEALSSILGKDEVRTNFETWSATLLKHAGLLSPGSVGQFIGQHKAAFGAGGVGGAAMAVPGIADQVATGGRKLVSWARRGLRISDAVEDMENADDLQQKLRQGGPSSDNTPKEDGIHPQMSTATPLPYPSQHDDVPQREKLISSPGGLAYVDDVARNAFRGKFKPRRFR